MVSFSSQDQGLSTDALTRTAGDESRNPERTKTRNRLLPARPLFVLSFFRVFVIHVSSYTSAQGYLAGARIPSRTPSQANPFARLIAGWESRPGKGRERILGPAWMGFSAQRNSLLIVNQKGRSALRSDLPYVGWIDDWQLYPLVSSWRLGA